MSLIEGIEGTRLLGRGVQGSARFGRTSDLIVGAGHGDNYEAVDRGNVFIAANQTGVTTQAGLSGTTPALTLYNPLNSGYKAALIYAGCVLSVANAAAAVVWIASNTVLTAAAVTGTAALARNALLGSSGTPKMSCFTAATLPAAPIAIATLGVGLTGAITTVPSMPAIGRYFDGSLVLWPGAAISFQTSTASGASSFFGEFIWEEIEIA